MLTRADGGRTWNLVPFGNLVVDLIDVAAAHLRTARTTYDDDQYGTTTTSECIVGFMDGGRAGRVESSPATLVLIAASAEADGPYVTVGAVEASQGPSTLAAAWPDEFPDLEFGRRREVGGPTPMESWARKRSRDRVRAPLHVVRTWLGDQLSGLLDELSLLSPPSFVCGRVASTMSPESLARRQEDREKWDATMEKIAAAVVAWGEKGHGF